MNVTAQEVIDAQKEVISNLQSENIFMQLQIKKMQAELEKLQNENKVGEK